jgi:putative flavoprotein involved in K+ transport
VFSTDTLVIGGGQAGLAASRCLTESDIDHIVLERGHIAERWRRERWDSLRLLTPNWATRLPGWSYRGDEPNGYMTAAEVATYLSDYASSFEAPVLEGIAVTSVERWRSGFAVRTSDDAWLARKVIVATGWCDRPHIPAAAHALSPSLKQLAPTAYRNPSQLPSGGVLVVGASASGVQLADELVRSGRSVTLAVGGHSRLPRRYRGRDIWTWLEASGTFDLTIDAVRDRARARAEGSVQLVGRHSPDVDLPSLQQLGVRLTGRLVDGMGTSVTFAGDLGVTTRMADARMHQKLAAVDDYIDAHGLSDASAAAAEPTRVRVGRPLRHLDLRRAGISTVIWATGFTRSYPWLHVPVLDARGEIRQQRGITPVPGLYVLGQRFQHRRNSNFIDGVRHDATAVVDHITRCRHQPEYQAS